MRLPRLFRLPNIVKILFVQILLLILVSIGFYYWKGIPLVIIFAMVWFDKAILTHMKIHGELGIELVTIPVVLSGIIYGPVFGFVFGFVLTAVIGGLFELISWFISQPFEVGWPPILPSPDTFTLGLAAVIGGLLSGMSFILVVLIGSVVKNMIGIFVQKITTDDPIRFYFALNVMYNLALSVVAGKYLLQIAAL